MRVNAGFSRLLRLDGIWVRGVRFETGRVVVSVALRHRPLRCPLCDFSTPHRHNRQQVESTWRHLDLGVWRLELRAQLRRLECPEHGVRVEGVPFARHASGSRGISSSSSRGSRRAPTRRRSSGWSGSTGTRSGGSSRGCALMSLIATGCTTCLRSGSTRCPGADSTATSPWSLTTSASRSCGGTRATTPRPPMSSSSSSGRCGCLP